jgi:LCP family protein required for cell wall assembly
MTEQAEAAPAPQARPRRRFWRIVRWTAACLAVFLLIVAAGGYLAFRHLDGNIKALHPDLGTNRPERVTVLGKRQPLNILLIGSDSRAGQTATANPGGGDLSDTVILLHLSANRARAYGVSIPRDLIVNRPECPSKSGTGMVPGDPAAMFNTAYGVGREGCTIRTVEAMTHIRIDHFIVVRFDGVIAIADALGGVPVCVPVAVHDPGSDIELPAGRYDAKGDVALDYVRARLKVGNGSDVGRMRRQQAFLASMTNKTMSLGTLANPIRLFNFLDSATRSVQVDEGLASLSDLAELGRQVKNIGLDRVQFLTMPIGPYAPDPNRLAIGAGAAQLWDRLRNDLPLTKDQLAGGTSADTSDDGENDTSLGLSGGFSRSFVSASSPRADDGLAADPYGLCK